MPIPRVLFLFDGEEYKDKEADGEAVALLSVPAAWGMGRKCSADERGGDDADTHSSTFRGA